jgi:hypothetical protein
LVIVGLRRVRLDFALAIGSKGQVVDLIFWTISETDVGLVLDNLLKLQLGGSV